MCDNKPLLTEGIGIPLAWREIVGCSTYGSDRLSTISLFNGIVAGVTHMLMDHACCIEEGVPAYAAVPAVLVPCEACR